jgi:hypothetical protein
MHIGEQLARGIAFGACCSAMRNLTYTPHLNNLEFRLRAPNYGFPEMACIIIIIIIIIIIPLALQPAVGFGLSNNILTFFPICHQLSPSSLNPSSFFFPLFDF